MLFLSMLGQQKDAVDAAEIAITFREIDHPASLSVYQRIVFRLHQARVRIATCRSSSINNNRVITRLIIDYLRGLSHEYADHVASPPPPLFGAHWSV